MAVIKKERKPKPDASATRIQDPEGTRRNILEIASKEFALNGLSGARIDEIAARTRFSKRMIYYYFGDKEGLYLRALENAYRQVREGEAQLDIEGLSPVAALTRLVEFTFDHHHRHEEFIRMVMIENIHHGQYLEQSDAIRELNVTAIDHISRIYSRGVEEGVFRPGLDRDRTPLAGKRAVLLQRFQSHYLFDDLRTRLRRAGTTRAAQTQQRGDAVAFCRQGRSSRRTLSAPKLAVLAALP